MYVSAPAQTCLSDSGGPGFITLDGVEYLAGVTSRGDAECAEFGVDTRVDVYADWVKFYIDVNDPTVTDCGDDGTCALDCDSPDPDCPCEADGLCSTACETLNFDRDCPANCDFDSVCQEDSGCPVEDIDCNPTSQIGDPCVFDTSCVEGTCVPALEDDRVTYCSEPCSSDGDCPGEMVCADNAEAGEDTTMCHHLAPSPGAQGWSCSDDSQPVRRGALHPGEGGQHRAHLRQPLRRGPGVRRWLRVRSQPGSRRRARLSTGRRGLWLRRRRSVAPYTLGNARSAAARAFRAV